MKILTLFFLSLIFLSPIVTAHAEDFSMSDEEYQELMNEYNQQQARDWFFFIFGMVVGGVFTWAIVRDRYRKD